MTIRDRIEITAGAIRSRARELGLGALDSDTAYRLWDAQHGEQPETIAGQFYLVATDRQATRVVNLAVRRYSR